ncbi:MAG: heme lyase CcmF/NrfE family subunit [Proteobacteria bacterium]|nr:heme lyase CcmF/NrfE family subunit [Pseudomonadota bacterium]MBK9253271.1 heme lyase CcmF/NrfE family subunit [Pseudomonadota bacterium]
MIPEIGQFAMILALLLAVAQSFFGIAGPWRGNARWIQAVYPAVAGQFVMLGLAFGCLVWSLVHNDFTVKLVAGHSNTALPVYFRVAAAWGNHEGSLLFWVFVLSVWTLTVAAFANSLPRPFVARVLGVLGIISVGFLLFSLATSNPFERLPPGMPDGVDLNPVLQDFGLTIHPPMLYVGYVGFSVAFAFACAAMIEGKLDQTWARWTRPWTTVAWMFLTVGIALGAWWAYYELGWGGYWAWDPVENSILMPWLLGTALIHSLSVTDKRGLFKSWTLLLAIMTFSFCLLATFMVRSGVLVSVHSFAADPTRGIFILTFLALTIGGALTLYLWRAPLLRSEAGFDVVSRESFILFNNILLVISTAVVFGGTMAPIFVDLAGLGTMSVGPPYFNVMFLLPIFPLLALVSAGTFARWKRGNLGESRKRILSTLTLATVLGLAVMLGFYGDRSLLGPLGVILGLWIIASALVDPIDRWRRGLSVSPAVLGMTLAHIGLGILTTGITVMESDKLQRDVALAPGEQVQLGDYTFKFQGTEDVDGPNYEAVRAKIEVLYKGRPDSILLPERRNYWVQQQSLAEAALGVSWSRDLLATMGESVGGGVWSMRLQVRPLMRLLWLGSALMALGGLLATLDKRYRRVRAVATEPAQTTLTVQP